MRILMVSAEGPPLLRAGALIDVMSALPAELQAHGHEISVVLPFYREIRDDAKFKKERTGITVEVRVGDKTYDAEFWEGSLGGRNPVVHDRLRRIFRSAGCLRGARRSLTKTTRRDLSFLPKPFSNWRDG